MSSSSFTKNVDKLCGLVRKLEAVSSWGPLKGIEDKGKACKSLQAAAKNIQDALDFLHYSGQDVDGKLYEGALSDRGLLEVATKLGHDWKMLATQLGLKQYELEQIERDHPLQAVQQNKMALIIWRQKQQTKNRRQCKILDSLKQKLQFIKRQDIVDSFDEMVYSSLDTTVDEQDGDSNGNMNASIKIEIEEDLFALDTPSKPSKSEEQLNEEDACNQSPDLLEALAINKTSVYGEHVPEELSDAETVDIDEGINNQRPDLLETPVVVKSEGLDTFSKSDWGIKPQLLGYKYVTTAAHDQNSLWFVHCSDTTVDEQDGDSNGNMNASIKIEIEEDLFALDTSSKPSKSEEQLNEEDACNQSPDLLEALAINKTEEVSDAETVDLDEDINNQSPDLLETPVVVKSEGLEDLENFDEFIFEVDQKSTNHVDSEKKGSPNLPKDVTEGGNIDDEFSDDDFSDDLLVQLDEAEKSFALENSGSDLSGQADQVDEEDEDDSENQPADKKYLVTLKQYFGYSKFRPMQWKIIDSVLNDRRDTCVIMATGHGKSLCYQYPPLFTGKTTVVISPLISLMQDQVLGLKVANIEACFLGSAQQNMTQIKTEMMRGKYRLVYITPEFADAATDILHNLDKAVGIDLIAIDEAHCVSQWGHDFRSAYRSLGRIRKSFPKVPIMALTATATPEVRRDICKSLNLRNPLMVCTGFDRPNLFFSVSSKTSQLEDIRSKMTKKDSRYEFDGPTIIYCPTKRTTMDVAQCLSGMRVPSLPYHAGLTQKARDDAHHKFVNDQIQVVVATVAFGMGIDKPDVRKVIHYGAPKDIESYYQEVGRAGRDGIPSQCHVFFSNGDFNTAKHFINEMKNSTFKEHKMHMLRKMQQYLGIAGKCRRRLLLSHFESRGLEHIGGTPNCCDNCRRKIEMSRKQSYYDSKNWTMADSLMSDEEREYGKEARDLLSAIDALGNRYGLMTPIKFLTGSVDKKVQRFSNYNGFGSGKYKKIKWWSAFGKALILEGYLSEKPIEFGFGSVVELSQKGRSWLSKNRTAANVSLKMTPNADLVAEEKPAISVSIKPSIPMATASASTSSKKVNLGDFQHTPKTSPRLTPVVDEETLKLQAKMAALQNELYKELVKKRNEMSGETGYAPYSIASNKVLLDMANIRPSTKDTMVKLEDFPQAKVQKFGDMFITIITSFCRMHSGCKMDNFPDIDIQKVSPSLDINKLTETQRTSYVMYSQENLEVEEIASRRGFKTNTIISHLCEAVKIGLEVDIQKLGVNSRIEQLVTDTIRGPLKSDISRLMKIKDLLPDYIEFNHIKLVIASLSWKHGQEVLPSGELVILGGTTGTTSSLQKGASISSTDSNSESSEVLYLENASQNSQNMEGESSTSTGKRKLPSWMSSNKPISKKMKSNRLFR
ncbi:Werner syndrome ATP-dependent helicase-like [Pecten maximus]|uniref:Werner syndrome ATP-dependent helicase-like n=1 Tax=Pecten maximus TaxID=6579 RepID=UPI001458C48E|nr:Werner syndrome ATP-dependent helicase-like [Pecten maximus]